jgi:hypothetical protein
MRMFENPSSENQSRYPETADHPDQTLDSGCKPLRQAQEADPYASGHEANVAGHHNWATHLK